MLVLRADVLLGLTGGSAALGVSGFVGSGAELTDLRSEVSPAPAGSAVASENKAEGSV